MSIAFNGSTSKLQYAPGSALGLAYPFTIFMWTRTVSSTNAFAFEIGRINEPISGTDHLVAIYGDSSTFFRGMRSVGSSVSAVPSHLRTSAWSAVMVVYTSASSCTCYAGNGSVVTSANEPSTVNINVPGFDRFGIGASFHPSAVGFWNGDLACAAIWSSALTAGNFDTLRAGAVPSTVSPGTLYDYWSLLNSSSLTGVNGRVLTATSVSTGGTHPISEGGDTTPPVITGPSGATGSTSSITVNENTTAVHTFSANESVTWSLNGGADVAKFSINPSTGALSFISAPDFETPTDADTNNIYVVGVRATDGASNATTQTVSVTVANVAEAVPGFDFHSATGLVFADLAGALTGLARQTAVDIVVRAYNPSTGALVATSGTLTTDSNGRLPRWESASLSASTSYALLFTRASDGEVCAAKMTTT